ncbi:MAG: cation transporting ATPase C-terminal domain-containing protein [Syntrophothermus sp.]|uniref:P-type ATPase n=1 Tax=Syntrophothermus sp. TaxID=2736299 RepID=UPI00257D7BD5|nr:cation-transporting P-type ATPase [Syntrophothermus sp.]NSW82609.1 cation transporting ATPase C-terminal domain-containing protein [Syntrophothermus sp.]
MIVRVSGFNGDYRGLSKQEVISSQLEYGKNELVQEKKSTFLSRLLSIFKEPMFLLLFCTALLYFVLGEPRDGTVMLCFVVFRSAINLFHEWRTDKTLRALKDLAAPSVRVITNGTVESVNSTELTVGDLMILEEGERIPADGKIVEMHDLLIVYWPAANSAVKTAPLNPFQLVTAIGLAAVATLWWEIVKLFKATTV